MIDALRKALASPHASPVLLAIQVPYALAQRANGAARGLAGDLRAGLPALFRAESFGELSRRAGALADDLTASSTGVRPTGEWASFFER